MLALRKILGNVDPQQGAVEIQYTPRVEAIAYPHFAQQSLSTGPHTMDPENYSYVLETACNAVYVAEGTVHFPALDGSVHPFTFKTSPAWVVWEYHLTLGEDPTKISGVTPELVVKNFLQRTNLGQVSQRNKLAQAITQNIGNHLLRESSAPLQREGIEYIYRMTREVQIMASADYYSRLEDLLKENPRQHIQPQKYRYDLGAEEALDKSKLQHVRLTEQI